MADRPVSVRRSPLKLDGWRRLSRSVAQLVEHRSPKPAVGGSIPSGPVDSGDSQARAQVQYRQYQMALSSRGLGHGPLKAGTRVRIPLALLAGRKWLAVGFGFDGSPAPVPPTTEP